MREDESVKPRSATYEEGHPVTTPSDPDGPSISRFTYADLDHLRDSSPTSTLRVVALIDFDAFYAQCETVRLGLPPEQPLGVQQWHAVIAFNYPARAHGLKRGMSVDEAKSKCPDLLLQHVATWREGERDWAYRPDVRQHFDIDKAALDPYRIESRKALALVLRALPSLPVPCVEKASIDEMFLDLSAHVHHILLERYPILRSRIDGLDLLPLPQLTLNWSNDHLIGSDARETDWDDVACNIGAEIVRDLRQRILAELHYTTSAGVASNKMLAKLAAGYRKPNQQTIVRPCATTEFLDGQPYRKIRGMARLLGGELQDAFGGVTVGDLLHVSLNEMQSKLSPARGDWAYHTLRGWDDSAVVSRTAPKSILSQKTFVPNLRGLEQASVWLRLFAAELHERVLDLEPSMGRQRPRTLTVYHHPKGRFGPTYSKQTTLSPAKAFDQDLIYDVSYDLLRSLTSERPSWPCAALGVRLSQLVAVESPKGNIRQFLSTRVPEADTVTSDHPVVRHPSQQTPPNAPNEGCYRCPHCHSDVPDRDVLEHLDWHVAKDLQSCAA